MHAARKPEPAAFAGSLATTSPARRPQRLVLCLAMLLAATTAWLATDSATASRAVAADPELARLLRGMALLKLAIALGAATLLAWRLRAPARPVVAAAGTVGASLMVAGAVLIWRVAPVGLGALAFHTGLLTLIGTAWLDRQAIGALLAAALASRRAGAG